MFAAKLVQIAKLKSNAQKSTVDFLTNLINSEAKDTPDLHKWIYTCLAEAKLQLNDKERFLLDSMANCLFAKNALVTYRFREGMGFLNAILAFSMESLEFPADYFNEYSLTMGRQSQGVTLFKRNMLSMTDKSKKLSTKPELSDKQRAMEIPEVFCLHQLITDKSLSLCNQFQ